MSNSVPRRLYMAMYVHHPESNLCHHIADAQFLEERNQVSTMPELGHCSPIKGTVNGICSSSHQETELKSRPPDRTASGDAELARPDG